MQNKNSDDLDFNIEEVEQVIAPQIDTGDPSLEDPIDGGDSGDTKLDDSDTKIDDPEEPTNAAGAFSKSRRVFCC